MSKFIPFYLVGGLIALSWLVLPGHGPWDRWDLATFRLVNGWLGASPRWADLVAITNHRLFDLAVLACMGGILAACFFHLQGRERHRLVAMGVVMLLGALLINQFGHLLPISRPSPTLMVAGALRVSELSQIPTKDSAGDSFPGDHALFLMIFAGFALRYLPRWAAVVSRADGAPVLGPPYSCRCPLADGCLCGGPQSGPALPAAAAADPIVGSVDRAPPPQTASLPVLMFSPSPTHER